MAKLVASTAPSRSRLGNIHERVYRAGRTILGILALLQLSGAAAPDSFRFVILGDRTGEAQPGVYEQIWREVAAEKPAFVVSIGDTIQGLDDETAETEWKAVERILAPNKAIPLYLAPGNHDIWSPVSEKLFQKYAGHPPHYSFDHGPAHFTVLDNSRSDELSPEEMDFLESDLTAHAKQPLKFIVSHRPSWLIPAAFQNRDFPLHRLAKKYGVQYVIAGHVHQLLHVDLDGVTYLSVASSGGHLRASQKYEDGWFFGHTLVEVTGDKATLHIEEAKAPHGQGRETNPEAWGKLGLQNKAKP